MARETARIATTSDKRIIMAKNNIVYMEDYQREPPSTAKTRPPKVGSPRGKDRESFVKVPRWIMRTHAWGCLTPLDRAVWLEAAYLYNGENNGYIALPCRIIAGRVNASKDSVSRSIRSLCTYGFLRPMKASSFSQKDRKAAEYCLTHLRCDKTGKPASKEFAALRVQAPVAS